MYTFIARENVFPCVIEKNGSKIRDDKNMNFYHLACTRMYCCLSEDCN